MKKKTEDGKGGKRELRTETSAEPTGGDACGTHDNGVEMAANTSSPLRRHIER